MRLRFSLRDFLLCSIIIGLMIGWWIDHQRLTRNTQQIVVSYAVQWIDPQEVKRMGEAMFAEQPDVRINTNAGNTIVLFAPDSDHTKFREALRAIDRTESFGSALP